MNEEQIKELIANEVKKKLKEEKEQLAQMVENRFLYTGEFAGARKLIDVVNEWARR